MTKKSRLFQVGATLVIYLFRCVSYFVVLCQLIWFFHLDNSACREFDEDMYVILTHVSFSVLGLMINDCAGFVKLLHIYKECVWMENLGYFRSEFMLIVFRIYILWVNFTSVLIYNSVGRWYLLESVTELINVSYAKLYMHLIFCISAIYILFSV